MPFLPSVYRSVQWNVSYHKRRRYRAGFRIVKARPGPAKVAGLAKWRLERAIEYVEAHLAEPVSLAALATAAGLSRMRFAAQFKAATGQRPHEYLLRRRIERAQEALVKDKTPLVDIALSVGFQTQAHFTTVFKRFVGQPPDAWRRSRGVGA